MVDLLKTPHQLKQFKEFLQALAVMMKQHNPYTYLHQEQVANLARTIAKEMGLSPERVACIYYGSLVHDIGKIQISEDILNKPGSLDVEEFDLIKTHCDKGYEVIKNVTFPCDVSSIILQHHERCDGSGYPRGLKGDAMTLEARIVAVADVVEAMSFDRPYRRALGIDIALDEIIQNRGKLYDPDVVDACVKLFKEKRFTF